MSGGENDIKPAWSKEKRDWLLSMVANIQGKCAVLRHENNKLRAANDRLRRDSTGPYADAYWKAAAHINRIFSNVPDSILPDFATPGENKFEACVRLAEAYKAMSEKFDGDGDPVGWSIVAVGDDGSVLCRSPNGRRARFWFGAKK